MPAHDSAKTVEILEKLKSAILNIDWEISDDNIALLNDEIAELRTAWQGQKVHLIYLQILGALSQYIASTKEQGNPGAFPMLRAVFDSLEDMVINPGEEEQHSKKVMEHVEAYNELKNTVASGKAGREAAPEPEPEPEPELEPEEAGEEEPSTINRLLDDKEDHTTDSIFDSMLDEMVQVEPPDQEEAAPVPPPPPPQAPPARPAVQAAYNKDDGTEIEADRNIADEFAEADALLDNFFEDDVPAPGGLAAQAGEEFDLSVLDEEEGEVLDLDQGAQAEAEGPGLETGPELGLEQELAGEPALEHVEDSELDIFKIDEETGKEEMPPPAAAEEFPEMESALEEFFEEEEVAVPPQMVSEALEAREPGEDFVEVESALDDFFGEEEPQAPEAVGLEIEEALDLEIPVEAEVEGPPVAEAGPAATVAGLKELLLSVNWEVDDKLLERVDAEISALSDTLAGNDVALIHLNFLSTVLHHVDREQSRVISESMACLKMLTGSLEDLLADEGEDETTYAAQAVTAFIDWHELVVAEFEKRLEAAKRQGGDLAESIEGLELTSPAGETSETQKLKKEILSEVREILSQEMQAMRQELSAKD